MYRVLEGCPGCGACKAVCPVKAIEIKKQAVIESSKCIGCGICVTVCPVNLIKQDVKKDKNAPAKAAERKVKDGDKDER